tara:strand:+ start:49393 stop:49740 length:348 start_codon:yes stop_codon:yes gene_type:complete
MIKRIKEAVLAALDRLNEQHLSPPRDAVELDKSDLLYPIAKAPGYYVSIEREEVYSIKSGELKKLQRKLWDGHYRCQLSVKGKKRGIIAERKFLMRIAEFDTGNYLTLPVKCKRG